MERAALITGGSSGIGLAIARALREDGFELTLAARTREKVEAAAQELGALAVAADVADDADCRRIVDEHRGRHGRLDVLVNSAGVGIAGNIADLPTKHLDLQLDVNLRGLMLVTAAALPLLREAQQHLSVAIDEAMAAVLVTEGGSIRTTGALAGLSENAVGPRLARTRLLAAYGSETGRVTAAGVERARYDLEEGRHRDGTDLPEPPPPMRFRARRPI